MARRTFDVIDICEIFTHWHAGRSKNEIAGSLGLSRNTVRKYLATPLRWEPRWEPKAIAPVNDCWPPAGARQWRPGNLHR